MNEQITGKTSNLNQTPPVQPVEVTFSARTAVRVTFLVLFVLFVVSVAQTLFYDLRLLLLLIVFAIFFAYLVAPLVQLMQRPLGARRLPRAVAIAIVYLGIFAGLFLAGTYLVPLLSNQVAQLVQQLPVYSNQLRARFEEINRRFERTPMPPALRDSIENGLTRLAEENFGELASSTFSAVFSGAFTLFPALILIPILGFFILKDAELLKLGFVRAFPRGQLRGRAELFLQDLNKTLRAYTRAQLLSCLLIGTVCTVAFYIIGVPYALLLGIVAAALEFIPLVGPLTLAVIAVTIASFTSAQQAVTTAIFLFVLRMIHDYVTYPRIVREGIHLPPLGIILAVLAGGEIGGVTGIFLAIPVVAVATVAYRHLMEHSGSAGLVAELLDEGKTDKAIDVAEKQLDIIHEDALANKENRQAAKLQS